MRSAATAAAVTTLLLLALAAARAAPGSGTGGQAETGSAPQAASTKNEEKPPAEPDTGRAGRADLKRGQVLYLKNCVACHRADGSGGVKPVASGSPSPNFRDPAFWKERQDARLVRVVEEGIPNSGMVSMRKVLSREEIRDVVSYIRRRFEPRREAESAGADAARPDTSRIERPAGGSN